MAGLDSTLFAAYIIERYIKPNAIMLAMLENNPVLGRMTKRTDLGGESLRVPITRTAAQSRSRTYATAKAAATGSTTEKFNVTYGSNYHVGLLDGNLLDDTKGDKNAIYDAIDHEMKGAMSVMKNDISCNLFGNLGGARGQVGSLSTVTLTLKNPEDSVNFEVGMEICAAATDGTSGALRDSGQAITVIAVNREDGEIVADENWSEIASIAADDYLFCEGDFGIAWSGFLGWIPATAPTSGDSFYGVDRSDDTNRLAGLRYTASGESIESSFVSAASLGLLYDAEPNLGVLNPVTWGQLANSLGADRGNRITEIKDTTGRISYSAIMMATPAGDIPIVADRGNQTDYGLLLDMSTWTCGSVGGDLVRVINLDGLTLRRGTGDNWLVEFKSRGCFYCDNPGRNVRIIF